MSRALGRQSWNGTDNCCRVINSLLVLVALTREMTRMQKTRRYGVLKITLLKYNRPLTSSRRISPSTSRLHDQQPALAARSVRLLDQMLQPNFLKSIPPLDVN
jgi:hypothetical protein